MAGVQNSANEDGVDHALEGRFATAEQKYDFDLAALVLRQYRREPPISTKR